MNKKILCLVSMLVVSMSGVGYAAAPDYEVSGKFRIAKVKAGGVDGSFCIYSENNALWVSDAMCPGNYQYVACTGDSGNSEFKLSIALAAYMADKPVQIQANGCCGTGVPCISEIDVSH